MLVTKNEQFGVKSAHIRTTISRLPAVNGNLKVSIRVMPDGFLSFEITSNSKEIRRAEHEYMNKYIVYPFFHDRPGKFAY